ncbi:MAG TPA: hypothetical protein VGD69_13555, partial [Herpetosiphonaceae bacterium]
MTYLLRVCRAGSRDQRGDRVPLTIFGQQIAQLAQMNKAALLVGWIALSWISLPHALQKIPEGTRVQRDLILGTFGTQTV